MTLDRKALPSVAAIRRRTAAAAIQRKAAPPARPAARTLQERLGNHGTQALIARAAKSSGTTKLPGKVSTPKERAELEAEAAARNVVRMREPAAKPPATGKSVAKGTVQRAESAPAAPARASHVPIAGGAPLSAPVRRFMEPRFGANFSNVRVHTGEPAARQSANLNAHAFTVGQNIFFGRDKFQPQSASGRELIAHELAHTIQQGATVQRAADVTVAERSETRVQRFGISDALDWIADKANYIPGFRLLTIVLGVNPINQAAVARTGANILLALLELIPVIGALIGQALEKYGILPKAGAWLDAQIKTLGFVGSTFKRALDKFLDSLGWSDILHPGDVIDRAIRIFTEPVDRLLAFGKSLVTGILGFIRDAILAPLAKLAEGTRGYDLLKAVLGKDPITGAPVPRTAETLIGGFMKLIGQEEIWENIKKANALPRAWAWFQEALQGLMSLVASIPTRIIDGIASLEVMDFILLPKALLKIGGIFGGIVLDFFKWAGGTIWNLLEIIFDVVSPKALAYIKKTGAALKDILKNPMPFMKNLIAAAELGFANFRDHFRTHLIDGLLDWLTGSLPGIYIPKALSLAEIAKFVLSILGISWGNIRAKLVKATNETVVKAMEEGFRIVMTLVTQGPAAAWDQIKEMLSNLKEMAISAIVDFVVGIVVKKAIPKLLSFFIPGLGFISAIMSIYDTVMVFVRKIAQIIEVVTAFVESLANIAAGAIGAAAARIEKALAGLLKLAINFFAGLVGLGNVASEVRGLIERIRAPIDKAIDWLVGWIKKGWAALVAKGKAVATAIFEWWKEKLGFRNKDGETHTLQFTGSGDSAKLAIASSLMPVREYLDNHPDKGKPEWNTANSVFTAALQVIYSPAAKKQAEKDRRKAIKDELAKVSAAFAKLSGDAPSATDYGVSKPPKYENPATVEIIVDKLLPGTKTGAWPEDKPGYKEIHEAGLTKVSDKWVQMHIISEKLGGSGTTLENLIPAPQSVNIGPFRSFEHGAAALVSGKGKIKNRVWVEVLVTGAKHAATAITGKAGLYFWKGKKASPQWLKNETPSLTSTARVPAPQLSGPQKLVLNFTSGTDMQRKFGISSTTAQLVKEGRPYASLQDFAKSMLLRGATQAQVNAVLNRGAVLDD